MPFRLPTSQEKERYVYDQFERIAVRYDLANDIISLGLHRLWKEAAVRELGIEPGGSYLDFCSGTGDVALRIAGHLGAEGRVTGVDFSGNMLAVARRREEKARAKRSIAATIDWVQADALNLPFPDSCFDGAIVSFGLRNLADIAKGLSEMSRVVKPGGRVVNLDVGHPSNPWFAPCFRIYFRHVVPLIGELIQHDRAAYTYLPVSAQAFPLPVELAGTMRESGIRDVSMRDLAFGAAAMQAGTKA